jgi:hypothetical protein
MTKAAELAKMGEVLTNSQIGRKNIVINGAMQISQRSASATGVGASDNVYPALDRYAVSIGAASAGRFTMSQSAVTDLNGFSNALKIDCTTADTSVAAGEALIIQQRIEGLACQQIKASSTSTNAYTISFYAKSNASRAIVLESKHTEGTNQQISSLHTIGTSWARYTMTVPAASSTEIDNDNTTGITIGFWIHAGTTYTSGTLNTASLAATTTANRAAGIGSVFASTDNTLEITGVQIEVGSQATPFEHRSFGEELALCQRYFHKSENTDSDYKRYAVVHVESGTNTRTKYPLPVPMRDHPALTKTGTLSIYGSNGAITDLSAISLNPVFTQTAGLGFRDVCISANVSSGLGSGTIGTLLSNNAVASLLFDAEL